MTTLNETTRSAHDLLAWSRGLVDPATSEAISNLPDPVRHIAGYHFGWWDENGRPTGGGGKALRPALALLACEAVGGSADQAVPAAVAVELVHNFSLLHDDVMDGDATRRHRATAWAVFGVNPAILVGDVLLTLAVEVLAVAGGPTRLLSAAVLDLLDGQNSDMAFEGRLDVTLPECLTMAAAKTGALLRSACALGAATGGGSPAQVARLGNFGSHLGLAFQLVDDLLGIWGDPEVTGKPVHSDLLNRKKSLPVVYALTSGTPAGHELLGLYESEDLLDPRHAAALVDQAGGRTWAQDHAAELLDQALAELHAAEPHKRATEELTALAHLVTHRKH
ncbi:MAG: family 2 encapsulin nanocompartment cargo protein polyprenyl transferase [Streptosporangiaceae bacterium]